MSDELKGPPPPGPIQPIFNDPLSQVERHRRALRAKADAITSPEARENVVSAAAAFGQQYGKVPGKRLPPAASSPTKSVPTSKPNGNQFTTPITQQTNKPMAKPQTNLIVPVNAMGQPVEDTRPQPEPAKLSFSPAPDGTFVKIADRPRPKNHPANQPWTQKFLATHNNEPFAIAKDQPVAELLANAINVYFHALMQRQAEAQARAAAEQAAESDATVFDTIPDGDTTLDPQEVDAIVGVPASAVGVDPDVERL